MDWHFAKSMPQIPHFYARRKEWPDKKQFEELVVFLRENSVEEKFFSKTFQYFYLNDWKYWTMGSLAEKTQIINKAKIKE